MDSKPLTELLERFVMLSCKHLGRCHDRRLVAIMSGICHSKKCQNRFTGTYISLDQTLHDCFAPHIRKDIIQRSFLCSGKLIGQFFHQSIYKTVIRK